MPSTTSITAHSLIDRIAAMYGLHIASCMPMQKGYRNQAYPLLLQDGSMVNMLLYKDEYGIVRTIRNANNVSGFLAGCDFPARRTVERRIIRVANGSNYKYASLYNFLPGRTIAWDAYTQKHIKLLGKTMSDMHAALQDFDSSDLPEVTEIYLQITARMRRYFATPGVNHALGAKLGLTIDVFVFDTLQTVLQACGKMPDKQALHMDFVRSNILFSDSADGPAISGIIDFEKTARGNPLFDIARTLAFLLVDCKYKPADKVRKYFLQSGYEKRGAARLPKIRITTESGTYDMLESLVDMFLTYDLYKFLKHNPYDFLDQNEHFVRTRDFLHKRNLVHIAKTNN